MVTSDTHSIYSIDNTHHWLKSPFSHTTICMFCIGHVLFNKYLNWLIQYACYALAYVSSTTHFIWLIQYIYMSFRRMPSACPGSRVRSELETAGETVGSFPTSSRSRPGTPYGRTNQYGDTTLVQNPCQIQPRYRTV